MKRITITAFLVLAVLSVAYWLLKPSGGSELQLEAVKPIESAQTTSAEDPPPVVGVDLTDEELAELSERFTPEEIENLKYSHQAALAANQNVVFYGKCIDQDGNPIPDVRVTAKITKMRRSMLSVVINDSFKYHETLTTRSDENGRFEFKDKGSALIFEGVECEGYLPARGPRRGYQFGQIMYGSAMAGMHEANPLKPVIFTLWKKGEASDAVDLEDRNGYRSDFGFSKSEMGSVLYYDLSERRKVTGASSVSVMEVIAHNEANVRWDPELFRTVGEGIGKAWSFTLELPGGGFVPTDDLFLFQPPESGYEEIYAFEVSEGERAKGWISRLEEQKFYFKTADGNYGAFALNVVATAQGEMGFRFNKLYFNPTGERSLEQF